jgi:hypothetical protein
LLQRSHAAQVRRHDRSDSNDADTDDRKRDQYLDEREAGLRAVSSWLYCARQFQSFRSAS